MDNQFINYSICFYDEYGEYMFTGNNEEFMNEFAIMFTKFFTDYHGKINVRETK